MSNDGQLLLRDDGGGEVGSLGTKLSTVERAETATKSGSLARPPSGVSD